MAPELSSNWKKLQAKIKAESAAPKQAPKRKSIEDVSPPEAKSQAKKRPKTAQPLQGSQSTKRPAPATSNAPPARSSKNRARSSSMGVSQSSKITSAVAPTTISPSLAVWAQDNDLSPERVAEAYGLGLKATTASGTTATGSGTQARPNAGLTPGLQLGKYVGIDCEMVGIGPGGHESILARVSVVDFHGNQVYDSLVRPKPGVVVTDWRTHVSGVSARDMRLARDFDEVHTQVAELLRGRIVVGHDIRHDLAVLELGHPLKDIRDTARFSGFRKYGNGPKPAMRILAKEILGLDIQDGQHSSVEDARVAMLLFRRHKPQFDVEHMNRYPDASGGSAQKGSASNKKTTKKKRKN
ncbi:hypothetical protein PpBr36_04617 [Pyricularia pennisetigena]|uniref:hypothetical protein n=1 Tax=Pyricularia pennisetigena TaxID=1578925 RepID=UPI00114DB11F|nr:hypothetical protein PpBr36_04617 [Pyricularia pennisetigena]TLS27132.1 hypothetical protein PpBr36_04617 [Pyricularia pennisetigena]